MGLRMVTDVNTPLIPPGWKRGWKVVHGNPSRGIRVPLHSVSAISGEVEYVPFAHVHPQPRCGPLCVFATKKQAQEWVQGVFGHWKTGGRGIWCIPCAYRPAKAPGVWNYVYPRTQYVSTLPPGTRLADEVMLLGSIREE